MVSDEITPSSIAIATVNGLTVEPGSKESVIERLRKCALFNWLRSFGLKSGALTMAKISPVFASRATKDALLAWCFFTAA